MTAKEARELAIKKNDFYNIMNDASEDTWQVIEEIEQAAEKGLREQSFRFLESTYFNDTVKILKKLGYKVKETEFYGKQGMIVRW